MATAISGTVASSAASVASVASAASAAALLKRIVPRPTVAAAAAAVAALAASPRPSSGARPVGAQPAVAVAAAKVARSLVLGSTSLSTAQTSLLAAPVAAQRRFASDQVMKAAMYRKFGGPIAVEDAPRPSAPRGGVVVEVHANGLCRSDWHAWRGHDDDIATFPHIPGHELAGIVAEVGAGVQEFKVGDRVVSPFILACGACHECSKLKLPTVCREQEQPGFSLWGSFAEFVALPRADLNLLTLPPAVAFDEGASLGCRLTTSYRAVAVQGRVGPGSTLAVLGCGGVGLSAVLVGRALGARVVAADVGAAARRRAEELGAEVTVDASMDDADVRQALLDATDGGADVALDCVGGAGTRSTVNALFALRRGGRLVQVALPKDGPALPVALFAARELELVGSHGASPEDLRGAMAMVEEGRLRPAELIAGRMSLTESCDHLMAMDAPDAAGGLGGVRVCVDFAK